MEFDRYPFCPERGTMTPIKSRIRTVPHYPQKGVMFRDITTLLKDAGGFRDAIQQLVDRYSGVAIDRVAGIEARGFIIGAAFGVPVGRGLRTDSQEGQAAGRNHRPGIPARIRNGPHRNACGCRHRRRPGFDGRRPDRDRRHGGGGLQVDRAHGARIVECCFIIDLPDLGGHARLQKLGHTVFALCEFEGD